MLSRRAQLLRRDLSRHGDIMSCPDPALCNRLRRHVHGRLWEWWTGNCPPERPCDQATREQYIELWETESLSLPTLQEQVEQAKRPRRTYRHWRKVWTFARALYRHVRHGLPYASPEDQAKRWAVCEPCEYRRPESNECMQCGCWLKGRGQIASKIAWASEKCPLLGNRPGPWWSEVEGEKIHRLAWRKAKQLIRKVPKIIVACII